MAVFTTHISTGVWRHRVYVFRLSLNANRNMASLILSIYDSISRPYFICWHMLKSRIRTSQRIRNVASNILEYHYSDALGLLLTPVRRCAILSSWISKSIDSCIKSANHSLLTKFSTETTNIHADVFSMVFRRCEVIA